MNRLLPATTVAFCVLWTGSSLPSPRCDVPLAERRLQVALQHEVEAEDWKLASIKPMTAVTRFNPTSLENLACIEYCRID